MAADTIHRIDAAYPPAADAAGPRDAALRALAREIDGTTRRPRRRAVLAVGAGAVALTLAGAGIVGLVLPGDGAQGLERADAATVKVLETGARAAERAPAAPLVGPGQYLYTHSIAVNQVTAEVDGAPTTYLVRHDRRSWLNASGGRILERNEPVRLLSGDRRFWESEMTRLRRNPVDEARASGLILVSDRFAEVGASDAELAARYDDPEGAAVLLREAASRYGGRDAQAQMFVMVGDGLRETDLSPPARAALFRAAAYIEGVRSLGTMRDSQGREGLAVARDADGMREILIFDPRTSAMLEERSATTGPLDWLPGVPAGTSLGQSTYLERGIVDSDTATP